MDLTELRQEIDRIDRELVALYEKRMEVCRKVAEYKIGSGKKVLDKEREKDKIRTVQELAHNEFNRCGVGELFEQIMAMSRKLQYRLLRENGKAEELSFDSVGEIPTDRVKVVFQGAEGAYSQAAMVEYFGEDVDSYHVDSFREAMVEIAEGKADFAVLPIENSTAGNITDVYDLLMEFDNYIVGEQVIRIRHCLLGTDDSRVEDIERVYAHPQALMQCAHYLNERGVQQIGMKNNAFAARKISEEGDVHQAAVAGEYAARVYGLKVLEEGINDCKTNATRFIIVSRRKMFLQNARKVSICIEIEHKSGALYQALSHFIFNGLNMNKIESRPIEDKDWEYRFFIDFDGNLEDDAVKNALFGLQEECSRMKILGKY